MEGQNTKPTFAHNGVQYLSQVMSMYPGQWNASSRRILLMDVAVLGKESNAADLAFRIHRLKENLLLPLATIILNEKEANESEKEKLNVNEQQLHASLKSLQEEKRKLEIQLKEGADQLAQQSIFIETLLEEMATASDQHKTVTEHLHHIILTKDLELQKLIAEKQQRFRNSDVYSHVESLKDSMSFIEWVSSSSEDCVSLERSASVSSNFGSTVTSLLSLPEDEIFVDQQYRFQAQEEKLLEKPSLVQVLVSGAWQEGLSSFRVVEERGIFSVPSAVLRFWLAMAGRVTEYTLSLIQFKMKQGFCYQF